MHRYVLKQSKTASTRDGRPCDREWSVIDLTTEEKVGQLCRALGAFIAESESLRSTAEAADPFLALRMVFRNGSFFLDVSGDIKPLTSDDLA